MDAMARYRVRAGAIAMPYGAFPSIRPIDIGKFNRCLRTLPATDFSLLAPHLRTVPLERGAMLHDAGDEIEHVYFPHSGMVSLVAVMRGGATVETMTVGRAGILGAMAALGSRYAVGRAMVQIAGEAARIPCALLHAAARESAAIRDLVLGYNDLMLAQIQQCVACNALHYLEARLCRWLLHTQDCVDAEAIPLTQESLGQMLGVRRTTLTVVARLLQTAGMIRYRRGLIHIVDRAALEENACECYALIKQHTNRLFPPSPQRAGLSPI
jgi:CRP-like cAMP-binding protein